MTGTSRESAPVTTPPPYNIGLGNIEIKFMYNIIHNFLHIIAQYAIIYQINISFLLFNKILRSRCSKNNYFESENEEQ